MTRSPLATILVLGLVWVTAGCSPSGGGATTVRKALTAEGSQDVSGYLIVEAGTAYLCDEIAESFPPQCGQHRIEVIGLDLATVADVQSFEDTSWTDRPITVGGTIGSGVLTVD